ncbi:MAG: hypothetical protein BWK76_18820 [Desulfobulbaceae bacterium A2]|nr:MAG: hypothetical protein BWK76_18820 [Desulfobulbaceae bacterium A2]
MAATMVLARARLDLLWQALTARGFQVLGPVVGEGAMLLGPVPDPSRLPAGLIDEQAPGRYRLLSDGYAGGRALFRWTLAAQGWKRFLLPPRRRLFAARREGQGFHLLPADEAGPAQAFFGVRPCELAAIRLLDRVFSRAGSEDPEYLARRAAVCLIGVDCTRAGSTCFCQAMHCGPALGEGFDLGLTELATPERHDFLLRAGSELGREIMAELGQRPATADELALGHRLVAEAGKGMTRCLPEGLPELLCTQPDHPVWHEIGRQCLGCANCTMVCPTCFCWAVEDTASLDGTESERWRRWDSCFSIEFSYIHGGAVRRDIAARYRQWLSHKLGTWHQQFGAAGCTGCGRCITWCPVGIDLIAASALLAEAKGDGLAKSICDG